tara:strand:+ start:3333 stop:3686 length:354 start_codon:yes stop_codon:yes gene_type:complete
VSDKTTKLTSLYLSVNEDRKAKEYLASIKDKDERELERKRMYGESKELTTEGIVDGILNHIKGILTKANKKQYKSDLQALAAESPEGKKAVDSLLKHMDGGAGAMAQIEKLQKELGY